MSLAWSQEKAQGPRQALTGAVPLLGCEVAVPSLKPPDEPAAWPFAAWLCPGEERPPAWLRPMLTAGSG